MTHVFHRNLRVTPPVAVGRAGDRILLAPPFIVADLHLGFIVERLHSAIDAALASL